MADEHTHPESVSRILLARDILNRCEVDAHDRLVLPGGLNTLLDILNKSLNNAGVKNG